MNIEFNGEKAILDKADLAALINNKSISDMTCNSADLKQFSTKELVQELQMRDGVDCTIVEPYQDREIRMIGPAVVLVVID